MHTYVNIYIHAYITYKYIHPYIHTLHTNAYIHTNTYIHNYMHNIHAFQFTWTSSFFHCNINFIYTLISPHMTSAVISHSITSTQFIQSGIFARPFLYTLQEYNICESHFNFMINNAAFHIYYNIIIFICV